jgi:triacylglycerol lipase
VFAPALPPYASVAVRAAALADAIDGALAGGEDACGNTPDVAPAKVNLIAHSMGGLDARFVVASLGYGDRVASVTTLSTPHRGSAIADMALGLTANVDPDAMNGLASWLERSLDTPSTVAPDLRAALVALAESTAVSFNADNLDDPRVRYQSWAGLSNVAGIANPQDKAACEGKLRGFDASFDRHVMHLELEPIAAVVAHAELRPNDGLVQVASAKWGTFRGCVPADHIDEVSAAAVSVTPFPTVTWARGRAFELAAAGL